MGFTLEQAFVKAKEIGKSAVARITVTTNQENGIVSYATGALGYSPRTTGSATTISIPESFSTKKGFELAILFSDRTFKIGTPPSDSFDLRDNQPFSLTANDKLGLLIVNEPSMLAKFTLVSHGNIRFEVPLKVMANIMFGEGAPVGNRARQALYTIAITDVFDNKVPK